MKSLRSLAVFAALTLVAARPVLAEEPKGSPAIDAEHIFGFTEGTDIGEKGELEFENTTVGTFSRPGSPFAVVTNELDARYGLTEAFRASAGVITDYHYIHGFSDLTDVSRLDFSGLASEFRWAAIPRADAPVGVTLSFAPYWRRIDSTSGEKYQNGALPLTLLMDRELIPGKLIAAVNATYAPTFEHVPGGGRTEHNIELS
ncbi:MAG TPA: hypothetical protein VED87_09005, partial [Methylocystis sp.]|nr:hypothetical protein [Methylocystis sp.]